MRDYLPLDNFWKRYNKVYLEKLALDKERQTLASENGRLRCLLKQYLDGISINDETFSQLNPLLIVNKRCNVKYVADDERSVAVVCAVVVIVMVVVV